MYQSKNKHFVNSYFFQCGRKVCFIDKDTAYNRADEIKLNGGPAMRVYRCPHCNGFHLAKIKKGK